MKIPSKHIENAVDQIASLPGIGRKTALRLVLNLLNRSKEAFSDGVSCQSRSLYEIIHDYVSEKQLNYTESYDYDKYLDATTNEQKYYIAVFNKYYKGCGNVIEHYWMPQYVNASDSSARTLSIYKKRNDITYQNNRKIECN